MFSKHIRKLQNKLFRNSTKIDKNEYSLDFNIIEISEHAHSIAKEIRGKSRKPSIIIHGIMPRSGTVYVGEILRLHPDLAYPNQIWEVPFLQLTDEIKSTQEQFFNSYKKNKRKIGKDDFLPIFGSSLIAYLYGYLPSDKRMLIKVPDVRYLNYFKTVFPNENLLILLRDGRDVVSSTIRTWPDKNFSEVCQRWDLSTKIALKYKEIYGNKKSGFWLAKYEDGVKDSKSFITDACKHFDLDVNLYPFDKMDEIKVIGSSTHKKDNKVTWDGMKKSKDFNPINRWSNWTDKEKNTFKKIAGDTLIKSGYCDDLDW
ncbi:MAG: sulfotransferase [Bacteroidetes bacterium]|nr:sulfotransferase [Bacteroidota bacterium]